MNGIGRLGDLYGLSPATLAGLADIAGASYSPAGLSAPTQSPAAPHDPDSPEAWEQAAAAAGAPGGVRIPGAGQTYGDMQSPTTKGLDPHETASAKTNTAGGTWVNGEFVPTPAAPAPAPPGPTQSPTSAPDQNALPSYTPLRSIPAHWQPGSHAVSVQHGMAPEELEPGQYHRDVAAGHGLIAADKRLEAAQQAGMADAVYASARAMVSQQTNERIAQLTRDRDQFIANDQKKLEQLAAATQKEVDPDAYFKKRGTLARVAAAVFTGLGQFATMWTGRGTNAAMQIIREGIDDEIKAQQTNIANGHKAYDIASNIYAQKLAAFGDKERAILATKMQYLDHVAALADVQRAKAGSSSNEAAYHDFLRNLNKEKALYADDFSKLTHTQATEQMNERFVPTQYVGGAASMKRPDNLVTLSDGTTVQMPSEKTQTDAIAKIEVYGKLQRFNNELLRVRKEAEKLDPLIDKSEFDKRIAILNDIGEQKAAMLSKSLEQGVLKDSEYKRAMELNVGATAGLGLFKGNPLARQERERTNEMLSRQTQRWDEDQRDIVKAAGGAVVQKGYARDGAGNLKPTGAYTGQDVQSSAALPPAGSQAMDPRATLRTAAPALKDVTPRAPAVVGRAVPAGVGAKKGADAKAPSPKRPK